MLCNYDIFIYFLEHGTEFQLNPLVWMVSSVDLIYLLRHWLFTVVFYGWCFKYNFKWTGAVSEAIKTFCDFFILTIGPLLITISDISCQISPRHTKFVMETCKRGMDSVYCITYKNFLVYVSFKVARALETRALIFLPSSPNLFAFVYTT